MKVKHKQIYSNECGICAILNLLDLYKIKYRNTNIILSKDGISLYDMKKQLLKYFKKVEVVSFDIKQLKKVKNFKPFIALIKKEDISHYVVIYKKSKKYLYILDSLANKSYKVTYETFEIIDGKSYILVEKEMDNKKLRFNYFMPFLSLIEALFLLSTTILIQQIIDNGISDALLYIVIQLLLLFITIYKAKCFLKTFKLIDENIINNTIINIYNLNNDYINSHNINEIYYRVNDAYSYKGMYLSFYYNLINDGVLAICTIVLMFIYSYVLSIIFLLLCVIAILITMYFFNKTKDVVERKRIAEYNFINTYRDSFKYYKEIYENNDKNYEKTSLNLLKEFQKLDYIHERISLIKNIILTAFQSLIVCLLVIVYFSELYKFITIGSLVALINLVTLVLQPILNICSQITLFSNYSLIKQRLKDLKINVKQ